jgi:hypothetical protein
VLVQGFRMPADCGTMMGSSPHHRVIAPPQREILMSHQPPRAPSGLRGLNILAWVLILCIGGPVVLCVAQWGVVGVAALLDQ